MYASGSKTTSTPMTASSRIAKSSSAQRRRFARWGTRWRPRTKRARFSKYNHILDGFAEIDPAYTAHRKEEMKSGGVSTQPPLPTAQHFLNLRPLPHGHGSFRPGLSARARRFESFDATIFVRQRSCQ